jgi:hypothetical protein
VAENQVPESLLPAPHGLSFSDLKELIEYLEQMQKGSEASMKHFRFGQEGFEHRVDPAKGPTKTSKASTATCLAYLKAGGQLSGTGWPESIRHKLRTKFVNGKWSSAKLPEDNPFTSAFLLEAIHDLGGWESMSDHQETRVRSKIKLLNDRLRADGGLKIEKYPSTSFLTHKVVKVLTQWDELADDSRKKVSSWNWNHLYQESMLIAAGSPEADYFELAYSVVTASLTAELDRMTPRHRRLLQHAIDQFFAGQRPDGNWPRSRPLFLYPDIGYAYCYDYELLVQLLSEWQLRQFVTPHLDELRKAAWALDSRRVPLGNDDSAFGWSSEHHGGFSEAESWPTASVFHFCFELQDLAFEAVRRDVFDYVDAVYDAPKREHSPGAPYLDLLNSDIPHKGRRFSFKKQFETHFIDPLVKERDMVRDGQQFSKTNVLNVSAILYGPPGTSKTKLAKMVAEALGWPLLSLDPSHLTRKGLDNVHAETDALFTRLQFCDQVVVLMDEFDELVREREGTGEMESRFLTTAMLPKIAALHERRRLVYIVATNHVEQFDVAISRPGRFDVIVSVMPPNRAAKEKEWPELARARQELIASNEDKAQLGVTLGDLTFDEAVALAARVKGVRDIDELKKAFADAFHDSALNSAVDPAARGSSKAEKGHPTTGDNSPVKQADPPETWKERLKSQESKIRGLGF